MVCGDTRWARDNKIHVVEVGVRASFVIETPFILTLFNLNTNKTKVRNEKEDQT